MAWLEGLAAKQGVPEEELFTKPEERAETPTAWVPEAAFEKIETPTIETPTAPAEGMPDWLKAAAAEVQGEAAVEAQPPAVVEAPETTGIEAQMAVEGVKPEGTTAPEGELPAAVISQEAGVAPGEAAPVEIPSPPTEWIKETELPEWLEKTTAEKPAEIAESEAELPGWIADAAAEEAKTTWEPPKTLEEEQPAAPPSDHTRTNINSASVGELERLPGIGFVLAQSIINHRASQGPFSRIDDLLDVPGIGPGTIEVLKNWITIQPVKAEILEEAGPPLDPDHIILKQAHIALHQGDIRAAIKLYEQLLSRLVLLTEIILDLQDALYRYPVDISIWQTLGDAYMRNNQLQDALDAYTKAEELLR